MDYSTQLLYKNKMHPEIYNSNLPFEEKIQLQDILDRKHNGNFRALLEEGAREAYSRQWHRLERGLRLNRIRLFIEDISPQFQLSKDEKDELFLFFRH